MFTTRTSFSLRFAALAMACVLGLRGIGWADEPPAAAKAAKRLDNASPLRSDPALQVKLTLDFKNPRAQEIVERLRTATKIDLTLADNIDRQRPALGGFSGRNVPAWIILEELAKSKIIQGKWERHGNGYLLTSPLPPPTLADAESSESSSPGGAAKLGLQYFLFALPLLVLFGILVLIRRRRSSQQVSVAQARPKQKEHSHPTGSRRS